jgi:hypothetical protein
MKVKDFLKFDPEATIVINGGLGSSYPITKISLDEGVYDKEDDSWQLLSENNLLDLEERYGQGEDSLAFVSLVVLG